VKDVGVRAGKHYSVNCPLREGMDDKAYRMVFQPVLQKVDGMENEFLSTFIPLAMRTWRTYEE
jgi:acetoin utilization deacetylase AcuC-like enzyme